MMRLANEAAAGSITRHARRRRSGCRCLVLLGFVVLQLAQSSLAAAGHVTKSYLSIEVPFFIHFPERKNISYAENGNEFFRALNGSQFGVYWKKIMGSKDRLSRKHASTCMKPRGWLSAIIFVLSQSVSITFFNDPERSAAVETVHSMIRETHDRWANSTKYSTGDMLKSLRAFARLQKAALYYEQHQIDNRRPIAPHSPTVLPATVESALVQDLAYYAGFANAVYGWKMDLAWNRRLHLGGNLQSLISNTNLSPGDVICSEWASKAHRPGYFLARDRFKKSLVLCVRGTWSFHDVLTDLCFLPDEVELPLKSARFLDSKQRFTIRAHHGMLKAAVRLKEAVNDLILRELQCNPDFSLVLVGHSMGGGLCALLRLLLEDIPAPVKVYIFGPPCVVSLKDWEMTRQAGIVSVTMDGDPFNRLSIGHLSDIGLAVSSLCENVDFREQIIRTCRGRVQNIGPERLRWCSDTYAHLKQLMANEKLVPPGRILRLSVSGTRSRRVLCVYDESPNHFLTLQAGTGVFNLQHHVPMSYKRFLGALASATSSLSQ